MIGPSGFRILEADPAVAAWADAARRRMKILLQDPEIRRKNLRHGQTWFVGVDVLPNAPDGSIDGVELSPSWAAELPDLPMHRAQLSIVYPGYPARDADESDANHRYRRTRCAAHVDGLLPVGPARRRFAREFHAYILALPLNDVAAAPTVIWPGSHIVMQQALRDAVGTRDIAQVDVTEAYHAARRAVFAQGAPVPLQIKPGEAAVIHRFALHGTQPWEGPPVEEGRQVAFFRPEFPHPTDWLSLP